MNEPNYHSTEHGEGAAEESILSQLALNQNQLSALLGVTPQAVSKGLKEGGVQFLRGRAQQLYATMVFIGGERYMSSAATLREIATKHGWQPIEDATRNDISATNLYSDADEMWIVGDHPAQVIDWMAMKDVLFTKRIQARDKVVAFFVSNLEAAERWAEVLEREAVQPGINQATYTLDESAGNIYKSYAYIIVTNMTTFSGDYVIVNPGSRCMGIFSRSKAAGMFYWNGYSYSKAGHVAEDFVHALHHLGVGESPTKLNFFPAGTRISREALDFPPQYIDGLIAKRGQTAAEDPSIAGENMVGGVLKASIQREGNTAEFNKQAKFCPVIILTYKRKPGDTFNTHSRRVERIRNELEQQKAENEKQKRQDTDSQASPSTTQGNGGFW